VKLARVTSSKLSLRGDLPKGTFSEARPAKLAVGEMGVKHKGREDGAKHDSKKLSARAKKSSPIGGLAAILSEGSGPTRELLFRSGRVRNEAHRSSRR